MPTGFLDQFTGMHEAANSSYTNLTRLLRSRDTYMVWEKQRERPIPFNQALESRLTSKAYSSSARGDSDPTKVG